MQPDLHSHTTASDGTLSPAELMHEAVSAGLTTLAITDHDTVAGWQQAVKAVPPELTLIPGIELSTQWNGIGIHIVGLNIDPKHEAIERAVAHQSDARLTRAEQMLSKLSKRNIRLSMDELLGDYAGHLPGRVHIARMLLDKGHVKNMQQAFTKYLGAGKPAFCQSNWLELETVIESINLSGGIAVLAHPLKYRLTFSKLTRCIDAFAASGGSAIEVISGAQDKDSILRLARLAKENNLLSSCGSDFHQPGQPWARLGKTAGLPENCKPVWEQWQPA